MTNLMSSGSIGQPRWVENSKLPTGFPSSGHFSAFSPRTSTRSRVRLKNWKKWRLGCGNAIPQPPGPSLMQENLMQVSILRSVGTVLFLADIVVIGFVRDLQDRAASEKDRLTEKEILFSAGHAYAAATYVLTSPSLSSYHGGMTESDFHIQGYAS